jgi:hypothetical protein
MGKKLNLVLRDPVKLHETESVTPELPSPFKSEEITKNDKGQLIEEKNRKSKNNNVEEISKRKIVRKSNSKNRKVSADVNDLKEEMSLRVGQVWEYFCEIAGERENNKNSFEVTRSEVMEKAGIGSSNTYRNALKKFQDLGLLEIELRPGVVQGSLFHLTKKGKEQMRLHTENK